jgi:hypothetical protein
MQEQPSEARGEEEEVGGQTLVNRPEEEGDSEEEGRQADVGLVSGGPPFYSHCLLLKKENHSKHQAQRTANKKLPNQKDLHRL